MANALLSSVSGLKAFQKMLDVAGNNLANTDTIAFKSSRITFVDLLSETVREASQPTANVGGVNPQQIGSGVAVASIDRSVAQGSLSNTGRPLDMAIEGTGFFVLNDGTQDYYTRVGAFAVDSQHYLVDPSTGYRVQRIGAEGLAEGFQDATSSGIRIPYDVAMEAKSTQRITYSGNLSADDATASTQMLSSGISYTSEGAEASTDTLLCDLDQTTGLADGDTLTITGTNPDGTTVTSMNLPIYAGTTTLGDVVDVINNGLREQFRGTETNAVATTDSAYITANGADSVMAITYDGVTRSIGAIGSGSDVEVSGLVAGGNLTLAQTVTAINQAFNGQTGATAGVMGDIASAVHVAGTGTDYVLQIQTNGETPNGAVIDFAIDGQTVGDVEWAVPGGTNVSAAALVNTIDGANTSGFTGTTATMSSGQIRLMDAESGYSLTDIDLAYMAGAGNPDADAAFELPKYFNLLSAGGLSAKSTTVEIFDTRGIGHTLQATFVRKDISTWDMVIASITGDVELVDRRITGVTFLADGSYGGTSDDTVFQLRFGHDPTNTRSLSMGFGTVGEADGLSQFGGSSTAANNGQDGYASGWLSDVDVTREGTLVGVFTNGVRKSVAALKIAAFQNPAGMAAIGNSFFTATANSGDAVEVKALSGGAGAIHGGSLEASNVDVADQFVSLIQAQNGYQASARTIKVTNEMLQELTNLIR